MVFLIGCILAICMGIYLARAYNRRKKHEPKKIERSTNQAVQSLVPRGELPIDAEIVYPERFVVADGRDELMSVAIVEKNSLSRTEGGGVLKQAGVIKSLGKLIEPLAQMVPATTTAIAANNSKLMEVVIDGKLLAAADGDGLRAIAKAPKGFEHARLHEPAQLQNIANAAAIWQIASVVVAQKHLADISATLKQIDSKVDALRQYLHNERSARVIACMHYLEDAKKAIDEGEFLGRTREKLEEFEIDLDRVAISLLREIESENKKELDRDSVGCEGEYMSAKKKHEGIAQLFSELSMCLEIRLANWYLCSLYWDKSKMLAPRLSQIQEQIRAANSCREMTESALRQDVSAIDARFTKEAVISQRRSDVQQASDNGLKPFKDSSQRVETTLNRINQVLIDKSMKQRLLVELRDGRPVAAYL